LVVEKRSLRGDPSPESAWAIPQQTQLSAAKNRDQTQQDTQILAQLPAKKT